MIKYLREFFLALVVMVFVNVVRQVIKNQHITFDTKDLTRIFIASIAFTIVLNLIKLKPAKTNQ